MNTRLLSFWREAQVLVSGTFRLAITAVQALKCEISYVGRAKGAKLQLQ